MENSLWEESLYNRGTSCFKTDERIREKGSESLNIILVLNY